MRVSSDRQVQQPSRHALKDTTEPSKMPLTLFVGTYAAATVAGIGAALAANATATLEPLGLLAIAYAAATLVVFAVSVANNNSSMYDPFWSVGPMLLVVAAWIAFGPPGNVTRAVLAVGLTWLWGARLTFSFWRGFPGLHHEDWRYVDLRAKSGRFYWLVSFTGIHGFPSVQTFLGSVPIIAAITGPNTPLGLLDLMAVLVVSMAVAMETVADRQLHTFVTGPRQPGETMEQGLWAYSRHPNYFGEISFWWGVALFGIAAGAPPWSLVGAASITLMFLFISLPMIEKRMVARRPAYRDVQRRVSMLVPWFRRSTDERSRS